MSTQNGDVAINDFTISFQDSCLTTEFAWPVFNTFEVNLYSTEIQTIPLAETLVLGCEPVEYGVTGVIPFDPTQPTLPDIIIDNNGGDPIIII